MNIKRIFSLILAVLMVASVLSACSASSSVPVALDDDGRFVYTVVRASKAESGAEEGAKTIRVAIKENFGCGITLLKDGAITDFDGNYEILVGDTNREESAEAKRILSENRANNKYDFIVKVMGDKIAIQAMSDEYVGTAANWFAKTFCENPDSFKMLTTDYQFIYEHDALKTDSVNTVNGVDLGLFTVVFPVKSSYLPSMYIEEVIDLYSDIGYDMVKIEDIDKEVKNEIIIGDTTRPESKEIDVEGDNYVIKVVNGDVIIKGGNDLSTWRGVKVFYDEVAKIINGKGISWSDGFIINGKYDPKEDGAYTLNWNDEFEGTKLDFNKWGEFGTMAPMTEQSSLGGLKCWQTPYGDSPYNSTGKTGLKKLIYQAGGNLHIGTQRLNDVDFVGGQISTYNTMLFRYGVFEVRSKIPPEPCSLGYWCFGDAFQIDKGEGRLANRYGGAMQFRTAATEIDILENFGSSKTFNTNVHVWWYDDPETGGYSSNHVSLDGNAAYTGKSKNNKKHEYDTERYGDNLSEDYHYYGVYWTDETMKFFFDGKTYLNYYYDDEPKGVSAHALMNYFITECQMGDASYGATYDPEEHGDYYEHIIDYVRIYQTGSMNSQLVTAWPQNEDKGELKYYYPENSTGGEF